MLLAEKPAHAPEKEGARRRGRNRTRRGSPSFCCIASDLCTTTASAGRTQPLSVFFSERFCEGRAIRVRAKMSNPVYDDLAVGASLQDDFLRDFMSAVRVNKSARLEIFFLLVSFGRPLPLDPRFFLILARPGS